MKQTTHELSERPATVAYYLAWLAAALAAVSAVAGLVVPGLYRDSEGWIRQARAADFVTLLAVVPVLVVCLWHGMTGKGRLIGLAALGYLVYTYAIFGFSVAINLMTPLHFAVLGLSVWTLFLHGIALSQDDQLRGVKVRSPRRATAIFLLAVSALFGMMWFGQIADAITTGQASAELAGLGLSTNPVYTLDLAFALPFLALTGILLLRRWQRAGELGLIAVAWVGLMGLGVLAIFAFDALVGVPVPIGIAGVIAVIAAAGIVLAVYAVIPPPRTGRFCRSSRGFARYTAQ